MPTVQVSASLREMRATMRSVASQQALCSISVPMDKIRQMEAEIASLPPRKRKNWKWHSKDEFDTISIVVYDAEGVEVPGYGRVHFLQRMSQQKHALFDTI